AELAMGNQANGFVGGGRAHVGELLFLGDIDFHVLLAGVFAHDHAFVNFDDRADEKFAAFLQAPERIGRGNTRAVGDERTRGAESHVTTVFHPAFKDGVDESSAASVGEELAAQANQAARRDFEIEAHAAGAVIAHFEHFAAAAADSFHDDADETLGNVNDEALDGLHLFAVFGADDDFGFADHEFKTFPAHGFDEDGELEFAAAEDAEGFGRVGVFDADGDVGEQLFGEAVAKIARGEVIAFAAGKRAGVDAENHGERGLINDERLEGSGSFETGEGFADLNAFDAGDSDDVTGNDGVGFVALEAAEREELGNFGGDEAAIELADAYFIATIQRAVENATNGQAAKEFGVVQIGDLKLEDASGIAGRRRDFGDDGFKEGEEIAGIVADLAMSDAGAGVGVDDGKVELIFGGVEVNEEVVDFVQYFFGAGVGAVDFVEDNHRRKFGS